MKELIAFMEFTQRFADVERVIYRSKGDRKESDAEHSFQLALVGWYLNEKDSLGLDVSKIARYALVHDLAEAYAGDTPSYGFETEEKKTQHAREEEALARIRKEFPEAGELWKWIDLYQKRADEESKFTYVLDKILPVINMYITGHKEWIGFGQTLQHMIIEKEEKIKAYPAIAKYFWEVVELLRASGTIREK